MTAVAPVDVDINPNNNAQRYILWGNGRIDNIGGAPAITQSTTWYDRIDQPVGVAIHITNWTTGAGYVLDMQGGFQPINGAPALGSSSTPTIVSGVPYTASRVRMYVDWQWNPDGSGKGVVLDQYGQLYPFGGATAPSRTGPRWSTPKAKRLRMQWSPSMKAITLDWFGGLWTDYAATVGTSQLGTAIFSAARDLVITDWTSGSGYILDLYGGMHLIGSAPSPHGFPYNQGGDLARVMRLEPGTTATYWQVWASGQQFEYVSGTAPTVTAAANGPAGTVTDTTRPDLTWSYTDAQNDAQAGFQVLVFTSAFANGHNMSNPLTYASSALVARQGVQATARGIACPVDLPNGTYKLYVRVQDTTTLWSSWASASWTQNVAKPTSPSGLTATVNNSTFSVALSATCNVQQNAIYVLFEYSDDGGTTWTAVRGADAVPIGTTTTATDYDAPLGGTRMYRASGYGINPRVISDPSDTVSATVTSRAYVLTAVDDSTLGGEVQVTDAPTWSRNSVAGVFQGVGAEYPTVISDGTPKAKVQNLGITCNSDTDWALVEALVDSDSVLVLRDPFGDVTYCKVVGSWTRDQIRVFPRAGEPYPLGHVHHTVLPLQEVAQPGTAVSRLAFTVLS